MTEKIKYKDLSFCLKTLVVLGWIIVAICLFYFLIGFVTGIIMGL